MYQNNDSKFTYAPTVKINANYICVYDTLIDGAATPVNLRGGHAVNFWDNFHDMQMSPAAVKSIKKAVNTILFLSRKRHFDELKARKKVSCTGFRQNAVKKDKKHNAKYLCTFLTLTLQAKQEHTDDELTKGLINPLMSYARKYFGVRYYIWKKELQKNGNVHFHLVTDRFIDHKALRKAWNRLCNRGKVNGIKTPFTYVDQYRNKMLQRFAGGWDDKRILDDLRYSPNVQDRVNEQVEALEFKSRRQVTAIEYDLIFNKILNFEFQRYKRYYNEEMKKPAAEQFKSPNSTDISAVSTPQGVASYVAKYISKDFAVEDPSLNVYLNTVKFYKDTIWGLMREADKKRENGEDYTEERDLMEHYKNSLIDYREKECPIKGRIWFKSASLTPFLKGYSDFIDTETNDELFKLKDLLEARQKASKSKKELILRSEDAGTVTFLVNAFELQKLKLFGLYGKYLGFVEECIKENEKKGYYNF